MGTGRKKVCRSDTSGREGVEGAVAKLRTQDDLGVGDGGGGGSVHVPAPSVRLGTVDERATDLAEIDQSRGFLDDRSTCDTDIPLSSRKASKQREQEQIKNDRHTERSKQPRGSSSQTSSSLSSSEPSQGG